MGYKLWIYGEPFTGKSKFADSFPKPFVISTDGNLQFYENAEGVEVHDYESFVQALLDFDGEKYETLIIDVLDHTYDFAREKFLEKNGIEHESDFVQSGGMQTYGKGYALLRDQFWYLISKFGGQADNVVTLSHELSKVVKGKFGQEINKSQPATIPEKLISKYCGKNHFVGRAIKRGNQYVISFGKDPNEISGTRGLPAFEITNSYEAFVKHIGQ